MEDHHRRSIENVTRFLAPDAEVLALILGGSLAHGFAGPDSDIDVLLIVADEAYQERLQNNRITFYNQELCTYPAGYVDGKYYSQSLLKAVQAQGSEPARYAFQDAQILFSRLEGLAETLQQITRYPAEQKAARMRRFYAQFEAWYWYAGEGLKRRNQYLLNLAVSKLILFGGRLLLAHNEQLYPYHKWFLRVLAQAPDKPAEVMEQIEQLARDPSRDTIDLFYNTLKNFHAWEMSPAGWGGQFMLDSEWNWLAGQTPVDDL